MNQKDKSSGKYTQAFFISLAINIGLASSLVYMANKKSLSLELNGRVQTKKIEKPKFAHINAAEILTHFFEKSYEELLRYLADDTLIEDGYRKRDFALGCLVTFHHLDIQKALKGQILQEREIAFTHTDGGETVRVKVYPGLIDEQFDIIDHFAKVESWPLSTQGLFFALLRSKTSNQFPLALKETFYLTDEFNAIYRLFSLGNPLELDEVLALILEGDWDLLEKTFESYKSNDELSLEKQREFLVHLVEQGSKKAAFQLLSRDFDFVTKKLDDELITRLLNFSEGTIFEEELAKSVYTSYRSERVVQLSKELLAAKGAVLPCALKSRVNSKDEKTSEPQKMSSSQKPSVYIVAKGDSLWKIAKKFDVTVASLQKINQISKNAYIKPGMKLKLP